MSARMNTRHYARESALALLYASDITEAQIVGIIEGGRYPTDGFDLPEYAETLLRGVADNLEAIDAHLSETSDNWAIDRMPVVDRAILRLATYEMIFEDDVPISVTIDEAVELAKVYGGEDESHRFVNGVLGRIARQIESGAIGAIEASGVIEAIGADTEEKARSEEEAEGAGHDGED